MSDLGDLSKKIEAARSAQNPDVPKKKSQKRNNAGAQAGMEFVLCIAFASFIGYQLDQWLNSLPLFLIGMFIFGTAAGFWSLYKYSQSQGKRTDDSILPEPENTAKNAREKLDS
jgi:F0F1-type ATP synthase assembly protein I